MRCFSRPPRPRTSSSRTRKPRRSQEAAPNRTPRKPIFGKPSVNLLLMSAPASRLSRRPTPVGCWCRSATLITAASPDDPAPRSHNGYDNHSIFEITPSGRGKPQQVLFSHIRVDLFRHGPKVLFPSGELHQAAARTRQQLQIVQSQVASLLVGQPIECPVLHSDRIDRDRYLLQYLGHL